MGCVLDGGSCINVFSNMVDEMSTSKRDPRMDPKAGDVIVFNGLCITVITTQAHLIEFTTDPTIAAKTRGRWTSIEFTTDKEPESNTVPMSVWRQLFRNTEITPQ